MDELLKRLVALNRARQSKDFTEFERNYKYEEIIELYKSKFYRNNRWHKKLIIGYCKNISDEDKKLISDTFKIYFNLNKTNKGFLAIVEQCNTKLKVPIQKHELNILINTLGYFYQTKLITVPSKKLAKIIFDSFQTNYQLSTIEDKIRMHKKSDPLGEISIKIDRRFTELQNEIHKYFTEANNPKTKVARTLLQKKI